MAKVQRSAIFVTIIVFASAVGFVLTHNGFANMQGNMRQQGPIIPSFPGPIKSVNCNTQQLLSHLPG